ncbi:hypothetical protein GPAL_1083 [Glaciecola pallidula DSM 14239 = ACAM 615]|uniref:Uncharacterized protein n=1 Tax=Brumicola pallidula DSM 14239 = ACAM 615 TaxID=1121922 RepID=K6ZC85_9ALTE|nr:hypothetical protein GPAL_1083 [Glaciecola pallidula DSM 14239 = ACAM 615]
MLRIIIADKQATTNENAVLFMRFWLKIRVLYTLCKCL